MDIASPRPHAPRRGDVEEVTVESLSHKGIGSATLRLLVGPQRDPRTYTLLIPRALPGDRVRVQLRKRRRNQVEAVITELLSPSPQRITPKCQHFGVFDEDTRGCGGCTLQTLSYEQQLTFKHRQITRLMKKHGLDEALVQPVIGLDDPWYYRNKMEFSFGDDPKGRFALGLHPPGRRYDILRLDACLLQSPFASALVPALRDWFESQGIRADIRRHEGGWLRTLTVREGKRTGERMVELMTSDAPETTWAGEARPSAEVAAAFCQRLLELAEASGEPIQTVYWTQQRIAKGERTRLTEHLLHGPPTLKERLHLPNKHQLEFEIHPRAFFQPNTLQAERLYTEVIRQTGLLDAADAPEHLLDLYCGTGTIALCLAPYADRVSGIELQPDAVDNARRNAEHNDIHNVTFYAGDVADVLDTPPLRDDRADLVIVDPPRSGLIPAARAQLKALAPPRIIYVSCNPVTLTNDLADFTANGYEIDHFQPVDMFPHTWHVESVVRLIRSPGAPEA